MGRFLGTKVILALAVLSLLWSILMLIVSFSYALNPTLGGNVDSGAVDMILLICNPISLLITFVLFLMWYVRKKKEDLLDDMIGILKLYRKISMAKVAEKMKITTGQAEQILMDCISMGYVSGYIDSATGEFQWEEPPASNPGFHE